MTPRRQPYIPLCKMREPGPSRLSARFFPRRPARSRKLVAGQGKSEFTLIGPPDALFTVRGLFSCFLQAMSKGVEPNHLVTIKRKYIHRAVELSDKFSLEADDDRIAILY